MVSSMLSRKFIVLCFEPSVYNFLLFNIPAYYNNSICETSSIDILFASFNKCISVPVQTVDEGDFVPVASTSAVILSYTVFNMITTGQCTVNM